MRDEDLVIVICLECDARIGPVDLNHPVRFTCLRCHTEVYFYMKGAEVALADQCVMMTPPMKRGGKHVCDSSH